MGTMSDTKTTDALPADEMDLLMGFEAQQNPSEAENTQSAEAFAEQILAEMDGEVPEDEITPEVSDEEEANWDEDDEGDEDEYPDEDDAEVSEDEESEEEADGSDEEGDEDESEDHRDGEPVPEDAIAFMDEQGNPVTAGEARNGYLRQSDYTRKLQGLSQERQETVQAREQALGEVQKAVEVLEDAEIVFSQMAGDPPDPRLRASDPGEYAAQVADWQNRQQMIQAIRERAAQERQKAQGMAQANHRDIMREQNQKLMERIPEWRDQEVRRNDLEQIASHFQQEYGYTPEELGQVVDHRAMDIMRKAMRYDQLQAQGKQTLKEAPKQESRKRKARPKPKGKKRSRDDRGRFSKNRRKVLQEQSERLNETGSVYDAARAIETFLGDDLL